MKKFQQPTVYIVVRIIIIIIIKENRIIINKSKYTNHQMNVLLKCFVVIVSNVKCVITIPVMFYINWSIYSLYCSMNSQDEQATIIQQTNNKDLVVDWRRWLVWLAWIQSTLFFYFLVTCFWYIVDIYIYIYMCVCVCVW